MMGPDASVNDAYTHDLDFLDRDESLEALAEDRASPRPRRRVAPLSGLTLCHPDTVTDWLVTQRPPRNRDGFLKAEYHPGKRFVLEADGSVSKPAYNVSGWFRSSVYMLDGIDSLHEAFERVRTSANTDGDAAYVIAGHLADGADARSAPRSKSARRVGTRYKPKGLQDAHRFWLVLDIDKIPNALNLDPRNGDEARLATVRFLRSLLPPELRAARCSWQISSSCCVRGADGRPLPAGQPPETLGAHLRFWMDDALDEAGRKDLLARIRAWTAGEMAERGIVGEGAGVDLATAIYNQAVFVTASFEGGLADPLPVRSGLIDDGLDEVRLDWLYAQLPEPPAPAIRVRKPVSAEETRTRAERRKHDSLLRGAHRQRKADVTPRMAALAEADPVPGVRLSRRPRSKGPQDRVLHASRVGKLSDIVALTDDRRTRDPAWANGLPEGMRRKAMLLVAGLLSHLVPVRELVRAIDEYGAYLTTQGWYDEEWAGRKQDQHIVRKAELAEAAERSGVDGSALRDDPWLERVMALFQPTHDEQVRLKLRSLRSNAARKEMARRARGTRTVAERRAHEAVASEAATRPWEAQGVSERTYRRRKKEAAEQAAAAVVDLRTATLSAQGLQDVLDLLKLAVHPDDRPALHRLAEGPLAGLGIADVSPNVEVSDFLRKRAGCAKGGKLVDAANVLTMLEHVYRAGSGTVDTLTWLLTEDPGYLAWAHTAHAGQAAVISVAELLQRAQGECDAWQFLADFSMPDAATETVRLRGSSGGLIPGYGEAVGVGGQTLAPARYPGPEAAGCSKATWFRRTKALRSEAAAAQAPEAEPISTTGSSRQPGELW